MDSLVAPIVLKRSVNSEQPDIKRFFLADGPEIWELDVSSIRPIRVTSMVKSDEEKI
jgi:hypothetical protein